MPMTTWPLWERAAFDRVAADPAAAASFAELAWYAQPAALQSFSVPPTDGHGPPSAVGAAGLAYQRIRDARWYRGWEAGGEPGGMVGSFRQLIRAALVCESHRAATCIDVAVLAAALGLQMRARPIIVVLEGGTHGASHHAMVLFANDARRTLGTATGAAGVHLASAETLALLADGLVAIDPTHALVAARADDLDAEASRSQATSDLEQAVLHGRTAVLVDVLACYEARPAHPRFLPPPRAYLPRQVLRRAADELPLFGPQTEAVAGIAGRRGTFVIHGDSGVGKTTAALCVARAHPAHAVIVVDGSSPSAVQASFARIAVADRGADPAAIDPADVGPFASDVSTRLSEASTAWCVVVDNADGAPETIERLLPTPNAEHDQLLLITTTNETWAHQTPRDDRWRLTGVVAHEVANRLTAVTDDPERLARLTALVGDTAVGLTSILTFVQRDGPARYAAQIDALLAASDADPARTGTACLVHATWAGRPDIGATLRRIVLLPPDRIPADAAVGSAKSLDVLLASGILQPAGEAGALWIHRLVLASVAAAVREFDDPQDRRAALDAVLTAPSTGAALEASADRELLERIADAVEAEERDRSSEIGSVQLGRWLARAAALLEFCGQTGRGTQLAADAVALFRAAVGDGDVPPASFGAALLLTARGAYRPTNAPLKDLETADADSRQAERLFEAAGDAGRAAQARRMNGLIRLKLAKHAGSEERVIEQTLRALEALERESRAIAARAEDDPALRAEALRARYNVAAAAAALANRSRDRALAAHSATSAREHYAAVGAGRRQLFGAAHHIQIAPCDSGVAFTKYLEAQRFEGDLRRRQALLDEAVESELLALRARYAIEGRLGGKDTAKSSRQLTKIAHARDLLNSGELSPRPKMLDEVHGGQAALKRLTATSDLEDFAAAWFDQPVLRALVDTDDNPRRPGSAAFVDALREHYARPLRGSAARERDAPVPPAARTLGLVDDFLPLRRGYDAAVVLPDRDRDRSQSFLDQAFDEGELVVATAVRAVEPRGDAFEDRVTAAIEAARAADPECGTVLIVCSRLHRLRALIVARTSYPDLAIETVGVGPEKEERVSDRAAEILAVAETLMPLRDAVV